MQIKNKRKPRISWVIAFIRNASTFLEYELSSLFQTPCIQDDDGY